MSEGYVQLETIHADELGRKIRADATIINNEEIYQLVVKLSDIAHNLINPAKEDGNLAVLAENTKNISVSKDVPDYENTEGVTLSLDLKGRKNFSVMVDLADKGGRVQIYYSDDGLIWIPFEGETFKNCYIKNFQCNFKKVMLKVFPPNISVKAILSA